MYRRRTQYSSFACGTSTLVILRWFHWHTQNSNAEISGKIFQIYVNIFDQMKLIFAEIFYSTRIFFDMISITLQCIDTYFNCFTSNISSSIKWLHHLKWHNLYWCQQIRSLIRLNLSTSRNGTCVYALCMYST